MKNTPVAIHLTIFLSLSVASCNSQPSRQKEIATSQTNSVSGQGKDCTLLETRKANAPKQKPAFEGQTRACGIKSETAFEVVVVAKGLEHPWAVEPLPDGNL